MATTSAARRRYQWGLLLLAAILLVAWLFVDGTGEPDPAADGGSSSAASSSPTHRFTATATPTTDPTSGASTDPGSALPVVRLADLPPEAARTLDLIDAGGPFEADRDGVTFENREELLPDRPTGYYAEYTVPTPGAEGRGARRIVTGDGGELYWTGDHYRSFSRITRT